MILLVAVLASAVDASAQLNLSSGATVGGSIRSPGDTGTWSFEALAGDQIILRVGRLSQTGGTLGFRPSLVLRSPEGTILASDSRASVAEVTATLAEAGVYSVAVADGNNGSTGPRDGTGTYRLFFARLPGSYVVPAGDDGGWLTNGVVREATIDRGDLDLWSFNAGAGDNIVVRMVKQADTGGALGFRPWLRLYSQTGAKLAAIEGSQFAEIALAVTDAGTFTLVASDGGTGAGAPYEGTGTYRLNVAGVGGAAELSLQSRSASSVALRAYGGRSGALYVIVSGRDLTTPIQLWTPILTNRFAADGQSISTATIDHGRVQEYYRLTIP